MQTCRISTSVPRMAIPARRTMAYCTPYARIARQAPPSVFPGFSTNDFAPFLRMFDEIESFIAPPSQPTRTFQPRFDVREESGAFHLVGEVPGIDQQDLQIEFVDQNTLIVRGRTVRESSRGALPATVEASRPHQTIEDAGKAAETTTEATNEARSASPASSYRKPSVEEEFVDLASETEGAATPNTTAETSAPTSEVTQTLAPASQEAAQQAEAQQDSSRYLVSERSIGDFQRTFKFPGHVDQDSVTASLRNGILSVVVPKAVVRQPRRVVIE